MKNKIAFTICSNNYLAQAKVLADSFKMYNSDYTFFIVLVDLLHDEIDYSVFTSSIILPMAEIDTIDVPYFVDKYSIIELNTVIKPNIFQYLFEKYNPEHIHFFDPDILFLGGFEEIDSYFDEYSILLTPHILTPKSFDDYTNEMTFLHYGIFNLGYCGFKNDDNTSKWLLWWASRIKDNCYIESTDGLFVDQKWMNYAPVFFEKCKIISHPGCNVAYWNLNERIISIDNCGEFRVNGTYNLLFFHFSKFDFKNKCLTRVQTIYNTEPNIAIQNLSEMYFDLCIANNYEIYRQIPCFYIEKKSLEQEKRFEKERKELVIKQEQIKQEEVNFILQSKRRLIKYCIAKVFPSFLFNLIDKLQLIANGLKYYKNIQLNKGNIQNQ